MPPVAVAAARSPLARATHAAPRWTRRAGPTDDVPVAYVISATRPLVRAGIVGAAMVAVAAAAVVIGACRTQRPTTHAPRDPGPAAPSVDQLYSVQRAAGEPRMRVRIAERAARVEIDGPPAVWVAELTTPASRAQLRTPIAVIATETSWMLRDGAGGTSRIERRGQWAGDDVLTLRPASDAMLRVNGHPFPGVLHLHGRREISGSLFDVVEQVPIERYLPGVVAKELYPAWSLEAFRAQSIAARSYALHERQRRISIGSHFDVESSTRDQVYGGVTDHSRAHEAVRDTAGVVLTWDGRILRAYYSSTTGGRAASARHTWPIGPGFEFNLAPPIQATPRRGADEFSPLYRWTVTRNRAALAGRLRAAGLGLAKMKGIATISVAQRNEHERPVAYTVTDTAGATWMLSAEQLRTACNHPASSAPAITRETRIHSGDFEAIVSDDAVTFYGRGFGHGVGMSQFGAEGLARQGWTAEQILLFYYPGATLERAY